MSKSNHQEPEEEGSGSSAATWWITGLVCLLVFGGIFWITGPGQTRSNRGVSHTAQDTTPQLPVPDGMNWPALTIDTEALSKARAEQMANLSSEEVLAHPASVQLREIVKTINDHQFVTQPIPSRTMESMEQELGVAISEALTLIEAKRFVALGEPLFEACDRGLEEVQEAITKKEASLDEVIKDADFERFADYRKHCGNMLGELRARGLVDDKGAWRDESSKALGKILQRYRWAHLVRLYAEPLTQLTPLERQTFVRWRVEDGDAFELKDRTRFVSELYRYHPDYPRGVAEAMLAYERGEKKSAAEILSRYRNQDPQNKTYQVMYDALSSELAKN